MKQIVNISIFTLITMIFVSATSYALDLSADEIIERANTASYYAGNDGKADVKMSIKSKGGITRVREFTLLRLNEDGGNQKFYTYFKAPADVYKMAYLVWKNIDANDDRWLWLPALNLKKRIAPGDKRTSFVGSDFVYEDVSGRNPNADVHNISEINNKYYVLDNIPKDPSSVEFSHYTVQIDKQTFLPMLAEYYDHSGRLYRRVSALEVKEVQGFPTVIVAQASDLVSGSVTRNEFSNISYNIGLNKRIFTERFLRRPPREVTR
ncbi:MAG: outer membrane lipoprotein-sorting protein [Desulfobacteraceae bacterium 4572_35.1]|nr:MAG: outer membrane lipoprotein-sorting protein [Desulfobacteraceae bacterium 4572_35.1]